MKASLDSARERLKRAEENIQNLNREFVAFFVPAPIIEVTVPQIALPIGRPVTEADVHPIITDKDRAAWEQLTDFIRNRTVPPRFSVLAGEIIHHLRSAFDHLAWQLSSPDFQTQSPNQIEFPVFKTAPALCEIAKNKISRYCRKVQGISSPTALARIESLQPHHGLDPSRHPLWLIHDMDRIDKHRALVLAIFIMQLRISAEGSAPAIARQMPWEIRPRQVRLVGLPNVEMKCSDVRPDNVQRTS